MFQFYGASRSGRWAGRLIQLQNLPQNHMTDLAEARELIRTGDYETMELLYEDIPDTLSQLIRTAFIPRNGYKFIVCDYSAIEARVLSYLAKETWRSRVFAEGKDIYCASASQMFHVPVEKHGINSHLRQKGKIAELALGYGGSVGALTSMGALEMGLSENELRPLVDAWRASNPNIVRFWWDVDAAVKTAIRQRMRTCVNGIRFECKSVFQKGEPPALPFIPKRQVKPHIVIPYDRDHPHAPFPSKYCSSAASRMPCTSFAATLVKYLLYSFAGSFTLTGFSASVFTGRSTPRISCAFPSDRLSAARPPCPLSAGCSSGP